MGFGSSGFGVQGAKHTGLHPEWNCGVGFGVEGLGFRVLAWYATCL